MCAAAAAVGSKVATEEEKVLVVASPYPHLEYMFNKPQEEHFADLELVFKDKSAKFMLHRALVARASHMLDGIIRCKVGASSLFDEKARQVEWMFGTSQVEQNVLEKVLAYCYGADLKLLTRECPAAIATVLRLQLSCADKVVNEIVEHMKKTAAADVSKGVQMLCACMEYQECSVGDTSASTQLAQIVLNFQKRTDEDCAAIERGLVKLPASFVEQTKFGNAHSKFSEFAVRMAYIESNFSQFSKAKTKRAFMQKCDLTELDSTELKRLQKAGFIEDKEMLTIVSSALAKKEVETKPKPSESNCLWTFLIQPPMDCSHIHRRAVWSKQTRQVSMTCFGLWASSCLCPARIISQCSRMMCKHSVSSWSIMCSRKSIRSTSKVCHHH